MADYQSDAKFSRRDFLGVSTGALAGVGVTSVANMFAQDQLPTSGEVLRKSIRSAESAPRSSAPGGFARDEHPGRMFTCALGRRLE
jgi:hypothetical protein